MKKNPIKTLIAFTLISTTILTAHAETQYSDTYNTCMDNSQGITVNMLDCIHAETKIQDARLNANYQQLMQHLPAKQKIALRNAQRTWIKHRDKQARSEGTSGGTIDLILINDKYLELTAERADHLAIKYNNLPKAQH